MSLGSSRPTCWMRFRFACRHWFIENIRAGVLDNDSSLHHDRSPVACLDEHYDVAGHQFGPTVPGRPGRRFGFWRWRRNRPRRSGHPVYKPESILVHPIRLSRRGWPEYARRADGPGRANTRRLFGRPLAWHNHPSEGSISTWTDGIGDGRRYRQPGGHGFVLPGLSVSPGDSTQSHSLRAIDRYFGHRSARVARLHPDRGSSDRPREQRPGGLRTPVSGFRRNGPGAGVSVSQTTGSEGQVRTMPQGWED